MIRVVQAAGKILMKRLLSLHGSKLIGVTRGRGEALCTGHADLSIVSWWHTAVSAEESTTNYILKHNND